MPNLSISRCIFPTLLCFLRGVNGARERDEGSCRVTSHYGLLFITEKRKQRGVTWSCRILRLVFSPPPPPSSRSQQFLSSLEIQSVQRDCVMVSVCCCDEYSPLTFTGCFFTDCPNSPSDFIKINLYSHHPSVCLSVCRIV